MKPPQTPPNAYAKASASAQGGALLRHNSSLFEDVEIICKAIKSKTAYPVGVKCW